MPPPGAGGGDLGGLLGMLQGAGGPGGTAGATVPNGPEAGVASAQLQIQQQIMAQFQQIEQQVMDLTGMLPGTEQIAQELLQGLDLWKRQAVMTMSQAPAAMPGAAQMI